MTRIQINPDAVKHIDAYLEYERIVGKDDNGIMMSEQEFEEYKKKVAQARKNHLYVSWRNPNGQDCKMIGPSSSCFCGHRYREHNFDDIQTRKVFCKAKKCACKLFSNIPIYGANDIKCLCKHSYKKHDPAKKKCLNDKCKCTQFSSTHYCSCGIKILEHITVFESREERESQGRPVDPSFMQSMAGGVGGIGTMTGLADEEDKKEIANQFANSNLSNELQNNIKDMKNMKNMKNIPLDDYKSSKIPNNDPQNEIEIKTQKEVHKIISSKPNKRSTNPKDKIIKSSTNALQEKMNFMNIND